MSLNHDQAASMMRTAAHSSRLGAKVRKLARNTYLMAGKPDGDYVVRYHDTDIITIHADGTFTLSTGGWLTMSTAARLREFSPARIGSDRGVWYITSDSDPLTPARVQKCRARGCHAGTIRVPRRELYHMDWSHWQDADGNLVSDPYGWVDADGNFTQTPDAASTFELKPGLTYVDTVKVHDGWEDAHDVTCRHCGGSGQYDYGSQHNPARFSDGIRVDAEGNVMGKVHARLHEETAEDKRNARLTARIDAYVALYTDDKQAELLEDAQANGTGGDCWLCMIGTGSNGRRTVFGDSGPKDNGSHLGEHVRERYLMASMMRNGCLTAAGNERRIIFPDLVRRDMRKYLRQRLLTGRAVR